MKNLTVSYKISLIYHNNNIIGTYVHILAHYKNRSKTIKFFKGFIVTLVVVFFFLFLDFRLEKQKQNSRENVHK